MNLYLAKNFQLLSFLFLFCFTKGAYVYYSLVTTSQPNSNVSLSFSPNELTIKLDEQSSFNLSLSKALKESVVITFSKDGVDSIELPWPNYTLHPNTTNVKVPIKTKDAGHVTITAKTSDKYIDMSKAFINIQVYHTTFMVIFSTVIGWIYFVLWTVSFYPQIYENFKRKSVVGLNLDFLLLNLLGHLSYNFFNIGLFWIPSVQHQYFEDNPHGVNPVQPNDVGFSLHAVFATTLTLFQACIYERGDQKVSLTCKILLSLMLTFLGISLILSIVHVITWLSYLYYFSYLKLAITLLKYCPQAYLNYKRKSTIGWSIGNVLMDLCGGFLSIVQMFLIAYNFSDWSSVFGDPTKFGLGVFSVLFDILFIVQHYILYRHRPNTLLDNSNSSNGPEQNYYTNEAISDKEIVRWCYSLILFRVELDYDILAGLLARNILYFWKY